MISIPAFLCLLWVHIVADVVFQTNTMAINKSKSNLWLFIHVSIYSGCFWPFIFVLGFWKTWWLITLTFIAHFATDYVTSRMTSKFWKVERRHAFFVTIGIDQGLHMTALILTYWLLSR
jgi:hypothetical protein